MSPFRAAALAVAALFAVSTARADDHWVFFGTYTSKDGSKGIYRSKFDDKTGKLSEPELAAEVEQPSFLAIHPTNKYLYAVGETGGKDGGGVFAFELDAKTGKLTKLNERTSGGDAPCHLSVNSTGNYVGVANYGGGSAAFFPLGKDGKLGERETLVQHKGTGPNKDRQEAPHAHCLMFEPLGKGAYCADLGTDRVKFYFHGPIRFMEMPESDLVLPPGSGPRHVALDDIYHAYVCGELDSSVSVVRLNLGKAAKPQVIQTLSTIPEPVKGNSTAECILRRVGTQKYVYVSNRGHNSIAAFKVGKDARLTAVGHITGDIKIPRNFNIDPSGKWMFIASADGGKVGVWELDEKTGLGKETGTTVKVTRPVCVKFVPVG